MKFQQPEIRMKNNPIKHFKRRKTDTGPAQQLSDWRQVGDVIGKTTLRPATAHNLALWTSDTGDRR